MEKRGLELAVRWFQEHHLQIGIIITDRHLQIQKWIRENLPQTTHYYDVWHVAKGKLVARKEQLVLKNQQIHVCIVVLHLSLHHLFLFRLKKEDTGSIKA